MKHRGRTAGQWVAGTVAGAGGWEPIAWTTSRKQSELEIAGGGFSPKACPWWHTFSSKSAPPNPSPNTFTKWEWVFRCPGQWGHLLFKPPQLGRQPSGDACLMCMKSWVWSPAPHKRHVVWYIPLLHWKFNSNLGYTRPYLKKEMLFHPVPAAAHWDFNNADHTYLQAWSWRWIFPLSSFDPWCDPRHSIVSFPQSAVIGSGSGTQMQTEANHMWHFLSQWFGRPQPMTKQILIRRLTSMFVFKKQK